MTSAAVSSNAAVLLLLFSHCLLLLPLFAGVLCLVLFCYAVLSVSSIFLKSSILAGEERERERELVAFL